MQTLQPHVLFVLLPAINALAVLPHVQGVLQAVFCSITLATRLALLAIIKLIQHASFVNLNVFLVTIPLAMSVQHALIRLFIILIRLPIIVQSAALFLITLIQDLWSVSVVNCLAKLA